MINSRWLIIGILVGYLISLFLNFIRAWWSYTLLILAIIFLMVLDVLEDRNKLNRGKNEKEKR